jgi:hypothetical protein
MKRLATLLAVAAFAVGSAGCGSSGVSGTIPATNASQLIGDLDAVQEASSTGDCATARARAQDFLTHVNELPAASGTALKEALRGAAGNLKQLVQQPCAAGATGAAGRQSTSDTNPATENTTTSTSTTSSTTTSTSTKETPSGPPPSHGNGNGNPAGGEPGGGGPPSGGGSGGGNGTGGTGGTGAGQGGGP